jgi:hypothetical protein
MGYSNYKKLRQVTDRFDTHVELRPLFTEPIQPISPSDWLVRSLEIAQMLPTFNEKVKSEMIISPILAEVHLLHKDKVTLFSGEELSVSPEEDLSGPCDFFFAANPNLYSLEAPIVAFAEAKDEDMEWGTAQCTAQMIASQRYNESKGKPTPTVWGCATTGGEWKFIKLTGNNLVVDSKNYYVDRIEILLGVFHHIIEQI